MDFGLPAYSRVDPYANDYGAAVGLPGLEMPKQTIGQLVADCVEMPADVTPDELSLAEHQVDIDKSVRGCHLVLEGACGAFYSTVADYVVYWRAWNAQWRAEFPA